MHNGSSGCLVALPVDLIGTIFLGRVVPPLADDDAGCVLGGLAGFVERFGLAALRGRFPGGTQSLVHAVPIGAEWGLAGGIAIVSLLLSILRGSVDSAVKLRMMPSRAITVDFRVGTRNKPDSSGRFRHVGQCAG